MRLFYLLSNLTLRPFDFLPERHWNFCRCKNLDSFLLSHSWAQWLSVGLFTVARVSDCACSQTDGRRV